MSDRKFTTTLKKVDIVIDDRMCQIVELSGAARDSYLEDLYSRMSDVTVTENGQTKTVRRVTRTAGMLTHLLSLCLKDDKGNAIPSKTIESWPASVVEELYKIADELSGLSEKSAKAKEEDSKNASGASGTTGTPSP